MSASITRMATLADAGRITEANAQEEITRLRSAWGDGVSTDTVSLIMGERAETLDLFDRCQLNTVLALCQNAATLSQAGRALFAQSRLEKAKSNDADRLRKYLARFELDFEQVQDKG